MPHCLASTIVKQNTTIDERLDKIEAGKPPNITKHKASNGLVDSLEDGGIQIYYEIRLIAERATSIKSFVYKIFTSVVPIEATYRLFKISASLTQTGKSR